MRRIGFSTCALARGDFRSALATLRSHGIRVVELSALRVTELDPIVQELTPYVVIYCPAVDYYIDLCRQVNL